MDTTGLIIQAVVLGVLRELVFIGIFVLGIFAGFKLGKVWPVVLGWIAAIIWEIIAISLIAIDVVHIFTIANGGA